MFSKVLLRPRSILRVTPKSYRDSIDYDRSNCVFFLYFLGRYNNMPLYYYGESLDITNIEFKLQRDLPFYEKKIVLPVEDNTHGKDTFDKFVKKNELRTQIPLYILHTNNLSIKNDYNDVITTSESCGSDEIERTIMEIYKCLPETRIFP
jgi:hypothetical protein